MQNKGMFFITTLQVSNHGEIKYSRCVGYCEDYESAKECVLNNSCDLFETIYNYAVIEEIPAGLYQFDLNPHWFQISDDHKSYHEIEKPKFVENRVGFAIG